MTDGSQFRSTVSRAILRDSRRVAREHPPLLRNEASDQPEDELLELPAPVAVVDENLPIRVLHVDDDPDILEVTKIYLKRADELISVDTETSAVEALNTLKEGKYDCIISDYDMPNTDGIEFLEIVREQYPDLPFILYTSMGSEAVASQAISAGVTEYMQKEAAPEQYDVLANRVCNAVERYRSQQQFWDALSWYHRLVEQDIAGVFIVQDGEFVYVNERMADIFGFMQSELLGESPSTITATDADEKLLAELLAMVDNQSHTFSRELTGTHADGTQIDVELHGGAIQYGNKPACIGILWRSRE